MVASETRSEPGLAFAWNVGEDGGGWEAHQEVNSRAELVSSFLPTQHKDHRSSGQVGPTDLGRACHRVGMPGRKAVEGPFQNPVCHGPAT